MPCPPPGDLPDPGIEPMSPVSPALQTGSLPTEPTNEMPSQVARSVLEPQLEFRVLGCNCASLRVSAVLTFRGLVNATHTRECSLLLQTDPGHSTRGGLASRVVQDAEMEERRRGKTE